MKCSIIDRSSICFDHLATPLQHTVDQSLYARLIQVRPGPLQKCWNSSQRGIVLHLLVGFRLDVIPEVLDGVAVEGSCRPFHTLNAIFLQKLIGDEFVFMDDNARPHRARVADQFLEENGIERMEWPARSPDCTPIKNLWDNIKRKANKKVNVRYLFGRISSAFCRGPGPTWINVAYKL